MRILPSGSTRFSVTKRGLPVEKEGKEGGGGDATTEPRYTLEFMEFMILIGVAAHGRQLISAGGATSCKCKTPGWAQVNIF